jgi:hypothetical protein
VPPEGRCMAQKMKEECEEITGAWWTQQAIEDIAVCQEGCCGIADGIKSEVLQRKECDELALRLGYDPEEDVEFDEGITNQVECFQKYATQDRGCCVLGGGQCEYGIREQCTTLGGTFIPLAGGEFCNDVTQCAATSHATCGCGELPGTEFDIYWYDSQGSQEDIVKNLRDCRNANVAESAKTSGDCNYPDSFCFQDKTEQVYCKSTSCYLEKGIDYFGDQKIIEHIGEGRGDYPFIASGDKPKLVEANEVADSIFLLTGQSQCYNFYSSYGDERLYLFGNEEYARSTGLQNEIIHCRLGDIEIEALGTDREKLCVMGGEQGQPTQHATVKINEWENCTDCGGGGFLGIGDLFGPFPPLGKTLASLLGSYCDWVSCQDYGDCVYHEDFPQFLGSTPIGSCNPMYPPGKVESCSECGRGGDGLWNICDETECKSMGDCSFTPASGWEKAAMYVILSLASTVMHKVMFIPVEFALCLPLEPIPGACESAQLWRDRTTRYVKNAVKPIGTLLTPLDWATKGPIPKAINIIVGIGTLGSIFNFF